jgi:hypothetical protein
VLNVLVADRRRNLNYDLLFNHLAPCESYKFVEAATLPFLFGKQPTATREMGWMPLFEKFFKFVEPNSEGTHSIANHLIMKGEDGSVRRSVKGIRARLSAHLRPVSWTEDPMGIEFLPQRAYATAKNMNASFTLASNRYNAIEAIDHALQRSIVKFDAGAYVHWYERHECSGHNFHDAFNSV